MKKLRLAAIVPVLLATGPLYYLAYQITPERRFELGSMDRNFSVRQGELHPSSLMSGPIRYEDGSVEVIDFYGRLTPRREEFLLPYHARRSPLKIFLRAHRFGLQGSVFLTVNGEPVEEFVFGETSYPWGGMRAVIPEGVAERGPLLIELLTQGGTTPPSHLPVDLGVGIDWIEIAPMSEGVELAPLRREYAALYVLVGLVFGFALLTGMTAFSAAIVAAIGLVLCLSLTALVPIETSMALARLWVVLPFAALVYWLLDRRYAAFVAQLVAVAALVHSALIFFPNHFPPDAQLHAMQTSWLSGFEWNVSNLSRYSKQLSRYITPDGNFMEVTPDGNFMEGEDTGQASSTYRAPYPPYFFMLIFGASRAYDDLRFLVEFVPVLMASIMLVLVFLIARTVFADEVVARLAGILFALEISVWHHVHRGHGPGIFGGLAVLTFIWFVISRREFFVRRRWFFALALASMGVALLYTSAFFQVSIFMACLLALGILSKEGRQSKALASTALGFALGIAGAVAIYYGPYALAALRPESVVLDRGGVYDPPATFLFMRNQLRDTVRLLQNGHALFVLASFVGLFYLPQSGASPNNRRIVWAALGTYAIMLLLKDPAFFPRIFLNAKEDLFYAPFACMVLALPLARLWRTPLGRFVVVAILAGLFSLAVRDQAWNADTLHPQPIAFVGAPALLPELYDLPQSVGSAKWALRTTRSYQSLVRSRSVRTTRGKLKNWLLP